MKAIQKGFTLIELVIVVAIVGVMAGIALPKYQNYTARAQFSEVTLMLNTAKEKINENLAKGYCMDRSDFKNNIITGKYVYQGIVTGLAYEDKSKVYTGCGLMVNFGSMDKSVSPLLQGKDFEFFLKRNGSWSVANRSGFDVTDLLDIVAPKSIDRVENAMAEENAMAVENR